MKKLLTFSDMELIGLAALFVLLLLQLVYYYALYNRIHRRSLSVSKGKIQFTEETPSLSVIICAKDAAYQLEENLPAILEQDYPQFEVIVVNDNSSDETEEVLTRMENRYPNLYHTFTSDSARYISRKKLALTVGIKASKYDWLVMTEPDCQPASQEWLRTIARNCLPGTDIVLGYSGHDKGKGWLRRKMAFGNLFDAMRYLGFALAARPYMGIGRNLAYRKELFFRNKGFSTYLNLRKGDDDLFVNETATATNTRVETDPKARISIRPSDNRHWWKEEKLNRAFTSAYYKGGQRYWLGGETLSRILFYILTVGLIADGIMHKAWLVAAMAFVAYIIRFSCQSSVVNRTAHDLNERGFLLTLPLFDFIHPLGNLYFQLRKTLGNKGDFLRK